jgi:hypothetical protein
MMSNMRSIITAATVATLIAIPVVSTAQTAARPELRIGDTWTYRYTGPGVARTEVLKVSEAVAKGGFRIAIEETSQSGAASITGEKAEPGERRMLVSADLNPMLRDPQNAPALQEFVRFRWPLEPGKSWSFPNNGASFTYTWDVKADGWESVTVPAGTFKALKLSMTRSGGRGSGSEVLWYAPEAKGLVKRVTHYSSSERRNAIDTTTIELTSYKVD